MMRSVRRIIPEVMERLLEQRELAIARQGTLQPANPRWHAYAVEIRLFDEQIERLEASAAALTARRQELDEARRNPARAR